MRAGPRRADRPRTGADEPVTRRNYIVHLVAEMVDTARRVPLQKCADRRGRAQRMQEFDPGVRKGHEHEADAVLGLVLDRAYLGAERRAPGLGGGAEIGDRDGDMVQASDHPQGSSRGRLWPAIGARTRDAVPQGLGPTLVLNPNRLVWRKCIPFVRSAAMPGPDPFPIRLPTPFGALLPLAGITLLAVEDSRFASEALRLLCLRSGARLKRTDSIAGAWRHLGVYRPDVALVDLGLPDGSGTELIARLVEPDAHWAGVTLATSGDPAGEAAALAAGAAGFVHKPLERLADFTGAILRHLVRPAAPVETRSATIAPDRQALRDDLHHAALLVRDGSPAPYVSAFVQSLARTSGDRALETLARNTVAMGAPGMSRLHNALTERLERMPQPFAAP